MTAIPAGPPGFISIQDTEGVTVGYVQADKREVRTSTTVEATDAEAVPAVEADKKARINTEWGVAAASLAMDLQEAAAAEATETVYVVDDDYDVTKVK